MVMSIGGHMNGSRRSSSTFKSNRDKSDLELGEIQIQANNTT